MKQAIRLTESELKQLISESIRRVLDEVDGTKKTLQRVGDYYSGVKGTFRRAFQPKKYAQYNRLKNQSAEMGRMAADRINQEGENVPLGTAGNVEFPDWPEYYRGEGNGDSEMPVRPNRPNASPEERQKYLDYHKKWGGKGRDLYNKRTGTYQGWLKTHGGEDRVKPLGGRW